MDLVVCPHCFTRVVPMEDRACPRCRARIEGVSQLEPITVRSGARLPMYCVACGAPAERLRTWTRTSAPAETDIGLLGGFFALFRLHAESQTFLVRVEYATFAGCSLPAEPRPQFEEGLVDLLVHHDFARRLAHP